MKHFVNPYPDYDGSPVIINSVQIKHLIEKYVKSILHDNDFGDSDGDLYVGTSGIAAMFLKLHQSKAVEALNDSALHNSKMFIDHAKSCVKNKPQDSAAFLCGNAGTFSVSTIIHQCLDEKLTAQQDYDQFIKGYSVCQKIDFNRYGCDEILFGRAGYLSGIYWLNQNLPVAKRISSDFVAKLCDVIIDSGAQYSRQHKLKIPMMWECYGKKYLGAAHGICSILHMVLESPLFLGDVTQLNEKQQLVKTSIDSFLSMQSPDGNFPCLLEDANKSDHKLIHWCHGAPGAVYLFVKAYLIFKDQKYLNSCLRCGDLVWRQGLLLKGPGICHGVAGNGYVFLILYRLTNDPKHLYRASKFAQFLTNETFLQNSRTPDRPFSLYEGIAGTVCFLIDLLQPDKASFPFMDVFDIKCQI